MSDVKRDPVLFDYTALNWEFLRKMARIPLHAAEKYGSWDQYKNARLTGEKSPINHAIDHLAKYMNGEPYDRWDGAVEWHLVAAAYNAMMEFFYLRRFGHVVHPLAAAIKEALTKESLPMNGCAKCGSMDDLLLIGGVQVLCRKHAPPPGPLEPPKPPHFKPVG